MAEKNIEGKKGYPILPDVLSEKWMRDKVNRMLSDLMTLLPKMNPEDRNRVMAELEKILKGDFSSQERLSK